jgi:phosphate/sulfate permease
MFGLDAWMTFLLIFCIIAALGFEFINGFHDTANAVATVIYTHSLKPRIAVIWSGFWNFIGVYLGGITVAMGIVNLLPTEALIDPNPYHSISMILALIITSVIWNLGTWYFGIPCSSSHALIGSIFGVGIAFMILPGGASIALNWTKVEDIGLSLLVSPIFGFGLAMVLMMLLKALIKNKKIFKEPPAHKAPPIWIRAILILTCTSVSFSHGSNDGQKGVGLVMIILIGIVPGYFAVDMTKNPKKLLNNANQIEISLNKIDTSALDIENSGRIKVLKTKIDSLQIVLNKQHQFNGTDKDKNFFIRKSIILISKQLDLLIFKNPDKKVLKLTDKDIQQCKASVGEFKGYTEYAPWWVVLLISLALGVGTMVGWKRIVITIGEKIGKSHLTYAQGASAEIVAAATIGASTWLGLPVSTTHVLSSGIAGTMVAGKGLKNLQAKTVRTIAIAWLVTLPVTILLSGGLFILFRYLMV